MPPSAYASLPVQSERRVATRYRIAFDQTELAAAVGVVERQTAFIAHQYACPIDQVNLTRPGEHA
ncbi:MAG TPA: hypothetical protein VGJ60_34130 [Chloroflexota bacterium]|jgi:hypothetical protein